MNVLYKVLALTLFFLFPPLYASEAVSIFTAEVEVVDQGKESRLAAMQQAMRQVLVRSSGSLFIDQEQDIVQALRRPEKYLQQYSLV